MHNNYYRVKTKEQDFEERLIGILEKLKGKNVIIFGANKEYKKLNKKYKFEEKFNVVAFSDFDIKSEKKFMSYRLIPPENIENEHYDSILIVNDCSEKTIKYINNDLLIVDKNIDSVFCEHFKDECENINYLYKLKFDKTLPKLIKKLKDKTVMLYGAGAFLELIKKHFDLSPINIIGIADRRFEEHGANETFLGYKTYAPYEIEKVNPDYVVVATKMYVSIIEDLYYETLKDTKIKIKPLLKKGFFELLREV